MDSCHQYTITKQVFSNMKNLKKLNISCCHIMTT